MTGRGAGPRDPDEAWLTPFLPPLKSDCTLVVVGALEEMAPMNNQKVACYRRRIAGALIEMLRIQAVNAACTCVEDGDMRFR